jgi:hypothetical protein
MGIDTRRTREKSQILAPEARTAEDQDSTEKQFNGRTIADGSRSSNAWSYFESG